MDADEVMGLLREAKVFEAVEAAGRVEDKKMMARRLTEFAGTLNHLTGKNMICEALLRKSLELDPELPETYYNLGVLYSSPEVLDERPKLVTEAVKHYELALKYRSDFHEARYNMALIHYFTGKKDKARQEYDRILGDIGDDRRFRELGMMFLEEERIKRYMK